MKILFFGMSRTHVRGVPAILALFDLDTDELKSLATVIVALAVGAVIAALWSIYDKRYIGGLVRRLLDEGCTSAETAKTLYELGFDDKLGVRHALREGGMLSRWVVSAEAETESGDKSESGSEDDISGNAGQKNKGKRRTKRGNTVDMDTAHYYVPLDIAGRAREKFSSKGTGAAGVIIVLAVVLAVLLLFAILLPRLSG